MLVKHLLNNSKNLSRSFSSISNKMTLETAKKIAAEKAVNEHVRDNINIGIGSGSTIVYGWLKY